jgi:hypothetical protein
MIYIRTSNDIKTEDIKRTPAYELIKGAEPMDSKVDIYISKFINKTVLNRGLVDCIALMGIEEAIDSLIIFKYIFVSPDYFKGLEEIADERRSKGAFFIDTGLDEQLKKFKKTGYFYTRLMISDVTDSPVFKNKEAIEIANGFTNFFDRVIKVDSDNFII